jgi:hypothetical protein
MRDVFLAGPHSDRLSLTRDVRGLGLVRTPRMTRGHPADADDRQVRNHVPTEVVSSRTLPMPLRLVALHVGPDIPVDKVLIVVGRHPACDARIDSRCVSRRHCCMVAVQGELEVKDLGSIHGIRINGHRIAAGRLRPGDELTIAHLRYRLVGDRGRESMTLAYPAGLECTESDGDYAPSGGPPVDRLPMGLGPPCEDADLDELGDSGPPEGIRGTSGL